MTPPSPNLSQQLHTLTKWGELAGDTTTGAPDYSLEFLLEKLPYKHPKSYKSLEMFKRPNDTWYIGYTYGVDGGDISDFDYAEADNPKDAVLKLLIELVKQGILK